MIFEYSSQASSNITISFSRISARIVMRGEKVVKQEYANPKFEDFTAYAFLDKHSNRLS